MLICKYLVYCDVSNFMPVCQLQIGRALTITQTIIIFY